MELERADAFRSGRGLLSNRPDQRIDIGLTMKRRSATAASVSRDCRAHDSWTGGLIRIYVYRVHPVAKKLTINVDDGADAALHGVMGRRFGGFLDDPHRCATSIPDADGPVLKSANRTPASGLGSLTGDIASEPGRLPLHGEVWWLAFKPSVAGEAHNNPATAIVSNRVAIRELNAMNGYELALLSISVI
jgi:hypothetical protein